jgi:hypothetical protein
VIERNDFSVQTQRNSYSGGRMAVASPRLGCHHEEMNLGGSPMRTLAAVPLALAACLAAAPACFADLQITLRDPNLPLWEMRPLDRHVYVLSLEGEWMKDMPQRDAEYRVNIEFPDGAVIEHRPPIDKMFRRGEVQVLLVQYQYEKHDLQKGDTLRIFITKRKPDGEPDDWEVVSNGLEVAWPFDRDIVRRPPRTRFTPPEPIDAFHPPGDEPAPPKPSPPPVEEPAKPPKPTDK